MRKGIVVYKESKNIGDDIQSLAAYILLGKENVQFLDRENLDSYNGDEIKLLCNGWFMHEPMNWPPSHKIHPYFISFHIAKYSKVKRRLLDDSLLDYYKQYGPIGCRDHLTKKIFTDIGAEAYYSGCLTLTLPKRNKTRSNKIIVTDLFINDILKGQYAKKVALKLIPRKYHERIQWITHIREDGNISIDEKFKEADVLLDLYASASLVITSRIHCALPCLALGTPVIFFDFGYIRKRNRSRFDGVLNLMNTVRPSIPFHENRRIDKLMKAFGLHKLFFPLIKPLDIDWDHPQPNPTDYESIAENLRQKVAEAFEKD